MESKSNKLPQERWLISDEQRGEMVGRMLTLLSEDLPQATTFAIKAAIDARKSSSEVRQAACDVAKAYQEAAFAFLKLSE